MLGSSRLLRASRGNGTVMRQLKAFIDNESGATAIEYGLIAALLGIAIIAGASALGTALGAKFNSIASNIGTAS